MMKYAWSLITGYCRLKSLSMNIVHDIILIILEYHRAFLQILKFDPKFKSDAVDTNNHAIARHYGASFSYILAGGPAVKRGVVVWRVKVCICLAKI